MSRLVGVALPLPIHSTFSYRVPEGSPLPERGARVLVPFGRRRVIGMVTGPGENLSGLGLKDLIEVLDREPPTTPPLLELASWLSAHYLAPPGECCRLVLPPGGVGASRAVVRLLGEAEGDPIVEALREGPLRLSTLTRRLGHLSASHLRRLRRSGVVEIDQSLAPAGFKHVRVASLAGQARATGRAQAEVIARLSKAGGRLKVPDLLVGRPSLRSAFRRLVSTGVVTVSDERDVRSPTLLSPTPTKNVQLSEEQRRCLGPIVRSVEGREFRSFLLHGITGSGKTEIYFHAAASALSQGRGVLILVPEIALTPLLVRAAVSRFGETVSVLHSDLSAGERHDQWWRIRERRARLVIGARSAVFAPVPDLGLVVVDEEHEAAYKQEESPRYHGRDVAVVRAKLEGCPVVLGSATPSVESYANALQGKYEALALVSRIGPRGLPRIETVDRRPLLKTGEEGILTAPLRGALVACVARKEQALLLLNRRGWATSIVCRECGLGAECPNCSVCLTLHRGGRLALCHYCGYESPAPVTCGSCRGEYLRLSGYGTEQVLSAVVEAVPGCRVDRLDRDLAVRRGAVGKVLEAFERGEIDVLVGTQMIAKGHDFPQVTLVGVIDADVALGLPDFRAAERTFQLITQVAGRAGRGDLPGEVILQSHLPDHYALRYACEQDYAGFFEREMEFRRTMSYPPTASLVNIILRSRQPQEAAKNAEALARQLRQRASGRFRVLGPARAPLARLKKEHRFQILLKGRRAAMRDAVRKAVEETLGLARWPDVAIDVDPVSVM